MCFFLFHWSKKGEIKSPKNQSRFVVCICIFCVHSSVLIDRLCNFNCRPSIHHWHLNGLFVWVKLLNGPIQRNFLSMQYFNILRPLFSCNLIISLVHCYRWASTWKFWLERVIYWHSLNIYSILFSGRYFLLRTSVYSLLVIEINEIHSFDKIKFKHRIFINGRVSTVIDIDMNKKKIYI